ncbi:MAG: hypothetical protein IKN17_05890 [Ruminococcus sp.]|nr:hypothetical protein [Ruminococcus sp.]
METAVRIGTVSDRNASTNKVRVNFPEDDMVSDWLPIVKHKPTSSNGTITDWFPKVGDMVLCIYDTSFNGQGYVIGGL